MAASVGPGRIKERALVTVSMIYTLLLVLTLCENLPNGEWESFGFAFFKRQGLALGIYYEITVTLVEKITLILGDENNV